MNNLVNNASALSLGSERLKVFTRYEAYRCKIPPTKKISNSAFRKFPQMPSLISPCEHKFLPPEETLKSWKKQLQDIIAITFGDYFVETDNGYYSVDTINGALQQYKARRVTKFVRQEIDWFSETFRMPSNLKIIPEKEPLQTFESIIHNNPYDRILPEFGMTSEELSQLCLKRLLSGDHMRYFIKIANQQEPEILYVYVNSVRDIKRFVDQQLMIKQGNIKHLIMILHIGKRRTIRDGKPLPTVFIIDDNNRGCHFVVPFVNLQNNVIYYGDSLGWSSPENLVSLVKEYTKYISNNPANISTSDQRCFNVVDQR